jgi:peptidoglycan/xylan/chitin deacetylase (PgdA/CDA1 family)
MVEHRAAYLVCVRGLRRGQHRRLVYRQLSRQREGRVHALAGSISKVSPSGLTASFSPAALGLPYKPIRWQLQSTYRGHGCTPAGVGACAVSYPGAPVLLKLHIPRLVGCVPRGPAFVNSGPTNRRAVALTFDDGPWPDTPQFLDVLEREHVPATFFQIGRQLSTYGRAVDRRMLADGDMIGDHTWNHADVAGGGSFAASEISRTAAAIRSLTGFQPCLFRAPGGAVSGGLIAEARRMGFTTIQWNVDPRDWARPGTSAIYANVVDNARNGSIIIQHDGGGDRSETLAALPREISTLRHRGFQFETVTQLLGMRLIYK